MAKQPKVEVQVYDRHKNPKYGMPSYFLTKKQALKFIGKHITKGNYMKVEAILFGKKVRR